MTRSTVTLVVEYNLEFKGPNEVESLGVKSLDICVFISKNGVSP